MLPDLTVLDLVFARRRTCDAAWRLDGRVPEGWHVLAVCLEGSLRYQVEGRAVDLLPGDLLCLPPGIARSARSDPLHPARLFSCGARLAALPDAARPALPLHVRTRAEDRAERIVDDLLAAWEGREPTLVRARLLDLLHLLLVRAGDPALDARLRRLRQRLAALPPAAPPPLAALAREMGLSPSRFRAVFQAATGLPPLRWHLHRRLLHARGLLLEGSDVASAAAAVGFADPHYFSRLFRRHLGATPSSCRAGGS